MRTHPKYLIEGTRNPRHDPTPNGLGVGVRHIKMSATAPLQRKRPTVSAGRFVFSRSHDARVYVDCVAIGFSPVSPAS